MSYLTDLMTEHRGENFFLHENYLNAQMVKVLKTIGYDRLYTRAVGPYLYDDKGNEYLDLLSGWGVFALGRNHPQVKAALQDVLAQDLPDLVQIDVSLLAGLLAERLLRFTPGDICKLFFCNSGAEAVEAAIKFSRYTTKRERILYLEHGFHGLTMGALSLNGEKLFQDGFGPLLPDCYPVPFNDLAALEKALHHRDVAAFVVEPIQGKGVNIPADDYLPEAARLCRKYGTLLVADEMQTGLGRTGKFFAVEHWGVEPDMICMAKALSGGFVPGRRGRDAQARHGRRLQPHGSRGRARLDLLEEQPGDGSRPRDAAGDRRGEAGRARRDRSAARSSATCRRSSAKHEFLKEVRGKGMMIALEFGSPKSLGAEGGVGVARDRQQGPLLPDDRDPALQEPPHPDPDRGPRHERAQAAAAARHRRARPRSGPSPRSTR